MFRFGGAVIAAVAILGVTSCGKKDQGADQAALAGDSQKDFSRPGAPKALDAGVPAWAQDVNGCEGQGLPQGGGRDEAAGVKVGMPQSAVEAALKCYKVSTVYSAGAFYFPDPDGKPVMIDSWLVSATREHYDSGELVEVLMAGPPERRQAYQVSYTVKYAGPPERLPSAAAVTAALQAQYGPLEGGSAFWYVIEDRDGNRLALNSPEQIRCNRPTDVACGRRLTVAYALGPDGTVAQRNITLGDGRIAGPILNATARRPG